MQDRHDHLSSGTPFFRVDVYRNSTTVITDGYRLISVNYHLYRLTMASEGLINRVIDNLKYHVM